MKIEEYKKGISYSFEQIEATVDNDTENLAIEELGEEYIGRNFIVVNDMNKDNGTEADTIEAQVFDRNELLNSFRKKQ